MNPNCFATVVVLAATLAGATGAQALSDANQQPALAASPMAHLAIGTVRSLDVTGRSATIDHQAIASLGLPAMTMQFQLSPASRLVLKPGLSMAFTFTASADGLTIVEAQPVQAAGTILTESAPVKRSVPGGDHAGMRGMPAGVESCGNMMWGSR